MLSGMWADVRQLIDDDDVELELEAAAWIITLRRIYEFGLLSGGVLAAYLILRHERWAVVVSWLIWAWFAADYLVRLHVANDRVAYVRTHRLELLAALPLDVLRPLRLVRVLRPLGMLARATKGMRDVLALSGFTLIGSIGVCVVLMGGALLTWIEPETAPSIADGMWWSIVTTTTVGYGDISPTTTGGRVVATLLMVSGIGLLGAVTGEVAERVVRHSDDRRATTGHPEVDHVIARLGDWSALSGTERRRLADLIHLLADEDDPADREETR